MTTTLSCTPAPTGNARRQEGGDDSGESCSAMGKYTIWPKDSKNLEEAKATWEQMVEMIGDDSSIEDLRDRRFMVDFWWATLSAAEAQAIGELDGVSPSPSKAPGEPLPLPKRGNQAGKLTKMLCCC